MEARAREAPSPPNSSSQHLGQDFVHPSVRVGASRPPGAGHRVDAHLDLHGPLLAPLTMEWAATAGPDFRAILCQVDPTHLPCPLGHTTLFFFGQPRLNKEVAVFQAKWTVEPMEKDEKPHMHAGGALLSQHLQLLGRPD